MSLFKDVVHECYTNLYSVHSRQCISTLIVRLVKADIIVRLVILEWTSGVIPLWT